MTVGGTGFSELISVNPVQPLKAKFSIVVTLLGIVSDVRLRQSLKAITPIEVTLFGMVTDAKL